MKTKTLLFLLIISQAFTLAAKESNAKDSVSTKTNIYKQLTDSATIKKGLFTIYELKNDYYFEIPDSILNREFLVINKILKVPYELNDTGINKGINYQNTLIQFEYDKSTDKLLVRKVRPKPHYPEEDFIAASIEENFISSYIGGLKIEGYNSDSTSYIIKINDLYNGKSAIFNDLFKRINIGGSATKDLSRIVRAKSFEDNVAIVSELSTKVDGGYTDVYLTVEALSSIVLLPETPAPGRFLSSRVGYFTVPYTFYSDKQSNVENKAIITRWKLEPTDEEAYLRGELVEPKKPIVFYLDKSTPSQWRKYMKQGIEDWQKAFEKAGFKNAIIAKDFTDDTDTDNINYSSINYIASEKMNAMGPSVYDPRSGEIIQADIIWWHNVVTILRNWIITQTGSARPEAQSWDLPEELLGDAMRFVACHEVGHSLGLRHNMIASSAFPVDSLRSNEFIKKWGSSASIMDYSRFNYVAQPGDNVEVLSPQIGVYDLFAIEYGYRWTGKTNPNDEEDFLEEILNNHTGRLYRYSEAQDPRDSTDPRAQIEDLGDDPVKASEYGIANLKHLMPKLLTITNNGKSTQGYKKAGQLHSAIIGHWNNLVYHPMANIGGIYIENNTRNSDQETYTFVSKEVQKKSLDFLIRETITDTDWLFNNELSKYTFPLQSSPYGLIENSPTKLLKNAQSYIFWDLLNNKRLIRMSEDEYQNGNNAFTPVEMMDILYDATFGATSKRKALSVKDRFIEKGLVDALIQAVSKDAASKQDRGLTSLYNDDNNAIDEDRAATVIRNISFYGSLSDRISDAISAKRGLLLRIKKTVEKGRRSSDAATRYHYEDLLLRINNALNT